MKNKERIIVYVWAISLVIIVAVGVVLCLQRPSPEMVQANREMLSLAKKIRTYYHNRPDYWGLDTNEVIKQKLHVSKLKDNQLINSLGKEIVVGDAQGTQIMPGTHSFVISYKNLTQKECVDMVSIRWQEEDKLGLISISIRNGQNNYEFSWGDKGLPLSQSQAKQYCKESNDLLWVFE